MAAAGDKSFDALAMPHLDAVYRVARRLARNEHEAEDLVQETYMKAWRAFDTFDLREFGIKPWLLRILHNTFINRSTRESRAPKATDQQNLEQMYEDTHTAATLEGPPVLDYEHLDAEVKEAIESLQPEFRSVLLLWATMEHSYQEIADILKVPIGTVMSRLHRARQHLTKALRDFAARNRLAPGIGVST
jgi:RNA polymerase sigma-70 factor (ECF subfamily)